MPCRGIRGATTVEKNDLTQIMEWPIWPAAYVMAAASLLMVTSMLLQLVQALRDLALGVATTMNS